MPPLSCLSMAASACSGWVSCYPLPLQSILYPAAREILLKHKPVWLTLLKTSKGSHLMSIKVYYQYQGIHGLTSWHHYLSNIISITLLCTHSVSATLASLYSLPYQVYLYLRTFAIIIPPAWNTLPPDYHMMYFPSSVGLCSHIPTSEKSSLTGCQVTPLLLLPLLLLPLPCFVFLIILITLGSKMLVDSHNDSRSKYYYYSHLTD